MTEVEVPRRVLALAVVGLFLVGLVVLGRLGWANSPRGGDGRPLLLTPERRAVRRYLDTAAAWAARMRGVGETLDGLTPVGSSLGSASEVEATAVLTLTEVVTAVALPPAAELPMPAAPVSPPGDLYRRVHAAQAAREALEGIEREVERTAAPEALVGLRDAFVLPALEAHVAWSDGVLAYVGAPESVRPDELMGLQAGAHAALAALEEALAQ